MKKLLSGTIVAACLAPCALGLLSLTGCAGDNGEESPQPANVVDDIDMGEDPEAYIEGEQEQQ